jgi:Leucine-rich repeat (LRR) protein
VPGLRVLTVAGNRLASLAGTEHLSELKELCVEGNRLNNIDGVSRLSSLKVGCKQCSKLSRATGPTTRLILLSTNAFPGSYFSLFFLFFFVLLNQQMNLHLVQALRAAANPISTLEDLRDLGGAGALTELVLADESYGASPVTAVAGYRDFVLFYTKGLRVLDYAAVRPSSPPRARALYLSACMAFGDKVEQIRAASLASVRATRRLAANDAENIAAMHASLVKALAFLGALVAVGFWIFFFFFHFFFFFFFL